MELRDISKILRKYRRKIVFLAIAGLAFGVMVSLLPSKYVSSGSLYVKREANPGTGYFTYEGYYAQQTAMSYTNSVVAILESPDIKKKVLGLMNIPVNEKTIRELGRTIKVKKTGPQVILVTVKNKNYDISMDVWDKTVNSLMGITADMNKNGDENLGISLVSERPVVKENYKSPYLFGIAGSLITLTLSLLFISVKEYLKD